MTSRERVLAAINHQQPDRLPIDFGSTTVTGITAVAYSHLRRHLGIDSGSIGIVDPFQLLAEVERPILELLGADVVGIFLSGGKLHGWQDWTLSDGTTVRMPADVELQQRDDGGWNMSRQGKREATMPSEGFYLDALEYPQWRTYDPEALTRQILEELKDQARYWHNESDYAIVLNAPFALFNGTSPEFLCALLLEKDEVHERLETWADGIISGVLQLLEAVGDFCDVIAFSGDLGTQKAPLISADLYREMILPHFRRVPQFIHEHSRLKVFYHSCGSVYELIDSLIEMGIDILNPLQVSAAGMEPERLVREFGGQIVFWGGGCDTQRILPQGTDQQVRLEVANRLDAYTAVPGYVFTPVHNIQPDVPPANIVAMYDEARRHVLKRS